MESFNVIDGIQSVSENAGPVSRPATPRSVPSLAASGSGGSTTPKRPGDVSPREVRPETVQRREGLRSPGASRDNSETLIAEEAANVLAGVVGWEPTERPLSLPGLLDVPYQIGDGHAGHGDSGDLNRGNSKETPSVHGPGQIGGVDPGPSVAAVRGGTPGGGASGSAAGTEAGLRCSHGDLWCPCSAAARYVSTAASGMLA